MSSKDKITLKVRGEVGEATAWMRQKQVYTRKELIDHLVAMGKTQKNAEYAATILLSPRASSNLGKDVRGNPSNRWGHIAYNEKLPRRIIDGRKEDQQFLFRLRGVELEPRKYEYQLKKMKTAQEKTAMKPKTKAKTKKTKRRKKKGVEQPAVNKMEVS